MSADEAALSAVADLIRELQPDSMVQRFVLMVETIDEDDRWISAFTAPDQKAWDTLGLLRYGMAYEEALMFEPLKEGEMTALELQPCRPVEAPVWPVERNRAASGTSGLESQ